MSQLYEASQLKDDRVRSVRHAEFLILNQICYEQNMNNMSLSAGVNRPFYDDVEKKRCFTAVKNMRRLFSGMMDKRVKYLPEELQEEHLLLSQERKPI